MTRWTSNVVNHDSSVVHAAFDAYFAPVVDGLPQSVYTRCGLYLSCEQVTSFTVTTEPLTCIRCVARATDGAERRRVMKEYMFAQMYGSNTRTLGQYAQADVELTLRLAGYRPTILQKCKRLSKALFAEAVRYA